MRVTGGRARGIPLKIPKDKRIRPALDQVRESIFSSIGASIENAVVLDLFSGTGSYGLESLSRGARSVTMIELEKQSTQTIRTNLVAVQKSMQLSAPKVDVTIHCCNVLQWQPILPNSFDYVFADPPYSILVEIQDGLFELARNSLQKEGILWLEAPGEYDFIPDGWVLLKKKGGKRGSPSILKYQMASFSS